MSFDDFWAVWPIKQNKAEAKMVWEKKRLDDKSAEIVAHIKRRVRMDAKWKAGYIVNAATFLRRERWQDEYETFVPRDQPPPQQEIAPPPQSDGYKAVMNRLILRMLRPEMSDECLQQLLAVRDRAAQHMHEAWGENPPKDEFVDLLGSVRDRFEAVIRESHGSEPATDSDGAARHTGRERGGYNPAEGRLR